MRTPDGRVRPGTSSASATGQPRPAGGLKRAAIYARYSTDLQSDRSIDDQVQLCRTYASREGLHVVAEYCDRARSSASLIGRDGFKDLLKDAKAARFDVLVVEALDRISRDQEDLSGVHKRLEFLRIEIRTVGSGRAGLMQIGLEGLMGQIWMGEHKRKVRRGLAGVVRDGRSAGGLAYGYRPVVGRPGELEIVAEEAAVIRQIFEDYVAGRSPREIAGSLNIAGVPAPRGVRWNASTINGQPDRGCGILLNPIYGGTRIWNRVSMVRDPDTGKRVSRPNPETEWQFDEVPHLAIVPQALFETAQQRKAGRRPDREQRQVGRAFAKPKRPLSGLLRCGCCSGSIVISKRRGSSVWGRCSTRQESGTCPNTREVRIDRIETAVLGQLSAELSNPTYVQAYLKAYFEELRTRRAANRHNHADLQKAAQRAKQAFQRAEKLYIDGITDGEEARATIRRLLDEARAAERRLAESQVKNDVIEIHPRAIDRYMAAISDLGGHLSAEPSPQAVMTLRELISRVVVTPEGPRVRIEVEGYLAALIGDPLPPCRGTIVAEEGFEPPTHGL